MTFTKDEFIAKCKAENPTMIQTINGVEILLSPDEYNAAVESWAQMQIEIQTASTLPSNSSIPQAGE